MGESDDPSPRDADRLIYMGLLGLSVTGLLHLVGIERELRLSENVSAYLFTLALPLITVGLLAEYARRTGTEIPIWRDLVGVGGAALAVAGFASLLFQINPIVGGVFIGASLLGLLLIRLR